MKRLFLLAFNLIFIASLGYSQVEFTKEVDEFTDATKIRTSFPTGVTRFKDKFIDNEQKLIITLSYITNEDEARDNGLYLLYGELTRDVGCLSSRESAMTLLFEDGERLELVYTGDADCGDNTKGAFMLTSREEYESEGFTIEDLKLSQKAYIEILLSKPVKKIRVEGTEYFMDAEVSLRYKMLIADHFKTIQNNF